MTDNTRARADLGAISVLDLSPITQGGTAAQSLHHSLDLARHAERWGYAREANIDLIVMGTRGRGGVSHLVAAAWPNASFGLRLVPS